MLFEKSFLPSKVIAVYQTMRLIWTEKSTTYSYLPTLALYKDKVHVLSRLNYIRIVRIGNISLRKHFMWMSKVDLSLIRFVPCERTSVCMSKVISYWSRKGRNNFYRNLPRAQILRTASTWIGNCITLKVYTITVWWRCWSTFMVKFLTKLVILCLIDNVLRRFFSIVTAYLNSVTNS